MKASLAVTVANIDWGETQEWCPAVYTAQSLKNVMLGLAPFLLPHD